MQIEALLTDYFNNWMSKDLQGKLEVDDEREGFTPDSPKITKNENGQLFVVMFYMELDRLGLITNNHKELFKEMLKLSECQPGLYYRRYKDTGINQSHDNIVALCAGSVVFNDNTAKLIAEYGANNSWCFNVKDPGNFAIECWIQGGDIAFIKLCAGLKPSVIEMMWYLVGRCIVRHDAGSVNLSQLRANTLEKLNLPWWVKPLNKLANYIFAKRNKVNGSYIWAVESYFSRSSGPVNPLINLARMKGNT